MQGKGFWEDIDEGKITAEQKILEQLLHVAIETLEWLTAESEEETVRELADIIIVLMDLCGGLGIDIDLNRMHSSLSLQQDCDALMAIKTFLDGTRKKGKFEQADVETLIKTCYCMYGKPVVLSYVDEKMDKNIQRPRKYGKQPFAMTLHANKT